MSDIFDIYEWNNSQRQLSLEENTPLSETNQELMDVLFEAKQLAQLLQNQPTPHFVNEVTDKCNEIKSIILGE